MKTFYDILGVDAKATQAQVKHAYRRKARGHHPDKGGEATAMADINRAYACLKDPGRRLTYDQTGKDQPPPSIDNVVRDVLLQCFSDLLNKNIEHDCLGYVHRAIQGKLRELNSKKTAALNAKQTLTNRRGKIKTVKGENVFHMLIDQNLQQIHNSIVQTEGFINAHNRALEVLGDYKSIEEVQHAITWTTGTNAFTSTGAW